MLTTPGRRRLGRSGASGGGPSALVAMSEKGGLEVDPTGRPWLPLFAGEDLPFAQVRRLCRALPGATLATPLGRTQTTTCTRQVAPSESPERPGGSGVPPVTAFVHV